MKSRFCISKKWINFSIFYRKSFVGWTLYWKPEVFDGSASTTSDRFGFWNLIGVQFLNQTQVIYLRILLGRSDIYASIQPHIEWIENIIDPERNSMSYSWKLTIIVLSIVAVATFGILLILVIVARNHAVLPKPNSMSSASAESIPSKWLTQVVTN